MSTQTLDYRSIHRRFADAIRAEHQTSGCPPSAAILGEHAYDELRAWAETLATVKDPTLPKGYSFQVMGVEVFKSWSLKAEIVMGCREYQDT